MVVLSVWQVVLSVPADLADDEAASVADEVRGRLEAWLEAETRRLAAIRPGCTVALEEE
jgi:hypothetical protein